MYKIHWHDAILCETNRLLVGGALFEEPFNYMVTFYFRGGFMRKIKHMVVQAALNSHDINAGDAAGSDTKGESKTTLLIIPNMV